MFVFEDGVGGLGSWGVGLGGVNGQQVLVCSVKLFFYKKPRHMRMRAIIKLREHMRMLLITVLNGVIRRRTDWSIFSPQLITIWCQIVGLRVLCFTPH